MAQNNKTALKVFFQKGKQPSEAQFASLVESSLNLQETGIQIYSGSLNMTGDITASGNISASGTIFANNFQSSGGEVDGVSFTDHINITGNMTASGDISASGHLTVGGNTKLFSDSAVIAPAKLYFGNSNVLTNA